ncbi:MULTISPECIES: helicase-associated domain-containing protein [Burkholderia cepacia complex]|nr:MULTISPECIES: helicase-associated domain-containing protein [Burkholderia cepacia complex]
MPALKPLGKTHSILPTAMLNDALARLTIDQLKSLMRWLPDTSPTGKKDLLIGQISRSLDDDGLRTLWERLDDIQRMAVAEAAYAPDGLFDGKRFRAKYGRLPDFTVMEDGRRSYYGRPTALGLFLYYEAGCYRLPFDLRERLQSFVREPLPVRLSPVETLPEEAGENRLTVRCNEHDATIDLLVLLRLTDQGKVQVSDKTSLPGTATLRLLTDHLAGGDFYVPPRKQRQRAAEIGPIKAFSWPLLLQAAGLAQRNGSKLALSDTGRKALASVPAKVLRAIWSKWLKSSLFDEFSRIDVIKGQKSKERVMTAVAPRRSVINEMLRICPVGAWINVDDLSRFMEAAGHTFEVTHDAWSLYIGESHYGSLGHAGYHDWSILQLRYLLCVLFEYAAALGIIDIAYIEPAGARHDYHQMWGTDELEFLSRYDGLTYFRVTPLGAYCIGLHDEYTPASVPPSVRLSVLPSLQVNIADGSLSMDESLTLTTWAEELTDKSWRLDRQKAVEAVEKGRDIAELRAYLQARVDQPLPETVESFIKTTEKRGKALKVLGTALLIDCENEEIASMIAEGKKTAGLCLRAGKRQLVVKLEHEEKFRKFVHELGLGVTI